jgi:small subunit ribosomal protein S16
MPSTETPSSKKEPREKKMAVHIRLARHGTKKAPYYRIVVTDSRNPRDGRFVEKLGAYNPVVEPKTFAIERSRYEYWTSKGALPSATLVQLLKKYPAKETVAG